VVGGDTPGVPVGGRVERVRLIGLNTPESVDPRRPVECFGREASRKAAGPPPTLRLYSLRHAAASLLPEETGYLKLVAAQLGHSTIVLTADVDSHVAPATQQEAAARLDAVLGGARYQRDT
jgi:integrase